MQEEILPNNTAIGITHNTAEIIRARLPTELAYKNRALHTPAAFAV